MKMIKRILALSLSLLVCLSGCGLGDDAENDEPVDDVPVSDAYFGMAHYQNGVLNPLTETASINRLLCEALYEGLFMVTEDFTAEPVLCSEYTGDGTTFTFTLRDDVTFWSGRQLTAADVVSCLQAVQNNSASPYYNRLVEVSSITAVGQNQVRITLSSPNINFPLLLDIPICHTDETTTDFADGTGPFRPEQQDGKWKLVANKEWHGGFLGSIRTITLVDMTRADAAESSFQTGDVSLLRVSRISTTSSSISGSVDAVKSRTADLHYLAFNYSREAFGKAEVRRALSAALPRQSICDTQLQTFADPAVLPVNPQPAEQQGKLNMEADTETSLSLLEQAALEEPLTITLLVNSDNPYKLAAAQQIAASWTAIGVKTTVDGQPYETFISRVQSGDFDVYYGETLLTADFDLRPLLSSGGSLNYGNCANETVQQALSAWRSGQGASSFYQAFLDQMPIVPVAFERDQLFLRQGLIDELTPAPYNAFAGLQNWRSTKE